jgi:hypothetical protein
VDGEGGDGGGWLGGDNGDDDGCLFVCFDVVFTPFHQVPRRPLSAIAKVMTIMMTMTMTRDFVLIGLWAMQQGSCRVIQFAVFRRGHRRLICALLHRQQVSQQHINVHTVVLSLTKLCPCLSQIAMLNPAFFHFSSGTSGDWVFEGGVVTFADVIAAWTSVHGDGGW